MKRRSLNFSIVSVLIFSFIFSSVSFAQKTPQKTFGSSGNQLNFRFSPLGLLSGSINGGVDFPITSEWTVGPEAAYVNYSITRTGDLTKDISITGYSVGARGNWYKNGVHTDGLYLSPSLNYVSLNLSTADINGAVTAQGNGLFLKGLVGYGWFWDSFNMLLGGGLVAGLGSSKVKVKSSSGSTTTEIDISRSLALEWMMGWTF